MGMEELLARWKEWRYTRQLPDMELKTLSSPAIKRLLLGLGVITALSGIGYGGYKVLGCAGSAVVSAVSGSSIDDYLPEGFKELELGMSYQEVQNRRPFIHTTGTEGVASERITRDNSSQEQILRAFGNEHPPQGPIEVDYGFSSNHLKRIGWRLYRMNSWNPTKGLFVELGEPTQTRAGYSRWEKGDVIIEFDADPRMNRYSIEEKKEE
ncbi:hypothetical protein HYU22_03380 [Candidatus Woesearchaeota archaeon]|nr:hypothetical protein [Candidatus Woesearchaeota archaeon]